MRSSREGEEAREGVPHPPSQPWRIDVQELLRDLEVEENHGLTEEETELRRSAHGRNQLKEVEQESLLAILLRQFRSIIMVVLALAVVLSLAFQQWIDGLAIFIAMLVNAGIGFVTEWKALRSMEALQAMDRDFSVVLRGGSSQEIDAEALVPGDIVLLESGDMISADLRVLESNNLQVDESPLTGESVPVAKDPGPVEPDTPLAERTSMLFKGTAVTRGSGKAVVVATGMNTELGGVTSLVQEAEAEKDPLSRRLDALAKRLVQGILVVAIIAGFAGLLSGKELFFMAEMAVALFVAAVPEGLPIVATLALARGMHRMARRNALVRRLSAVQTLGATNIILTDKTGTLTENRMTATTLLLEEGRVQVEGRGISTDGGFSRDDGKPVEPQSAGALGAALKVGVLCNNASLQNGEGVGDPTEVALLVLGAKANLRRGDLLQEMEEVREVSFHPDTKMMATYHRQGEDLLKAVKGAPEAVLQASDNIWGTDGPRGLTENDVEEWLERNDRLAGEGLRVLGLARGYADDPQDGPYQNLTFLGLVGLEDPIRDEVRDPLKTCREAGIRVIMVTGDQKETAIAVAKDLGLLEEADEARSGEGIESLESLDQKDRKDLRRGSVFYRVTPEQKLDLIALHQDAGNIVGMTGDGVNDAPALKKADIGIAMGKRGEEVAEDAADIVLQDDRFNSVTDAVEMGRVIFENIRYFVIYMISGNIGEILLVFLATLVGGPLPLLPLQILYINAVNDIFPALALGLGPGSGREMNQPPRDPDEPIMARRHWYQLGVLGAVIGLPVLAGFFLSLTTLGLPVEGAVTVSFLSVALARLWHVFNMRDRGSNLFRNQVTRNPWVWGALGLCVLLLLLAVYLPPLAEVLGVVSPSGREWALILSISLVPLVLGQALKGLRWI